MQPTAYVDATSNESRQDQIKTKQERMEEKMKASHERMKRT